MNSLWIALGFLSRFPSKHADFNAPDAARSVVWFPAVGMLIGAVIILVAQASAYGLGTGVAALIALGFWVWLTGALHLDGLADTMDGFSASSGGKNRALEAMKDSRIGAHGACALGLTLLAKWVLLVRCLEVGALVAGVLAATTLARLGVGFVLAWVNPAVPTGLGALFARELRTKGGRWLPWFGVVWLLVLTLGLPLLPGETWQTVVQGVGGSLLVAGAALILFARRCQACFGGVTGDTHGAAIEIVELMVLVVHAAVFGMVNA